jgi:hypothetical protein
MRVENPGAGRKETAMKKLAAVVLAAAVVILPACSDSPSEITGPPENVSGTGTLHQYGAGCTGWWILVADSGPSYQIADLESEFEQPGLRVRFTVKMLPPAMDVCMVGAAVDVVAMSKIQD